MYKTLEEINEYKLYTYNLGFLAGTLGTLFAVIVMLLLIIPYTSASPYQLNLTTGNLTDLNTSTDNTTVTINIYNYTNTNLTLQNISQNVSWINVTNITNLTCINCTQNYTNHTEWKVYNSIINDTQIASIYYTKTQVEELMSARISAVNANIDTVRSNMDAINSTIVEDDKEDKQQTFLWIGVAIAWIFSILALLTARQAAGGSE